MTLRFKAPRFVRNAISRRIAEALTDDSGVDVNFQIDEMEISMRNKRLYTHLSVGADISRKDLIKLIKNARN